MTYFVSSSCFFWKLFRMNYFMTILVFPKLFVFALFLYVIRFRFSTWLPTILVALPLPYSSSKGDRLIRDTRLFGYVAFNERCEALWSFTRFQALWQFSLVDPKCLWHRMTWKTVFVHHIELTVCIWIILTDKNWFHLTIPLIVVLRIVSQLYI